MSDAPFLNEKHPVSGRHAILEDDGKTGWLYLTEAKSLKPVGDVWVYNRVPAPAPEQIKQFRGGPPPAPIGHALPSGQCMNPNDLKWSFLWSPDGESVAVIQNSTPTAFVIGGKKRGHSLHLQKTGPWGEKWSEELYSKIFKHT
jgi:hypothetical protein